jgi:hypothetical protein
MTVNQPALHRPDSFTRGRQSQVTILRDLPPGIKPPASQKTAPKFLCGNILCYGFPGAFRGQAIPRHTAAIRAW